MAEDRRSLPREAFLYTITLGDTSFQIDPMHTRFVEMNGKRVGYIKEIKTVGDNLMADIVLTDPEARRLAGTPPCLPTVQNS